MWVMFFCVVYSLGFNSTDFWPNFSYIFISRSCNLSQGTPWKHASLCLNLKLLYQLKNTIQFSLKLIITKQLAFLSITLELTDSRLSESTPRPELEFPLTVFSEKGLGLWTAHHAVITDHRTSKGQRIPVRFNSE